jgi:hypothetical protein
MKIMQRPRRVGSGVLGLMSVLPTCWLRIEAAYGQGCGTAGNASSSRDGRGRGAAIDSYCD